MASRKQPKRASFQPYTGGVRTSINTQVANSADAVNNALNTVLYEDSMGNNGIWNLIKRAAPQLTPGTINANKKVIPGTLGFVLYDEPERDPIVEGHQPTVSNESESFDVFYYIPDSKFNDVQKHQCLGIMYNGRRLKIKFAGQNPETGLPYFYVEDPVFEKSGKNWVGTQTRWYGTFTDKSTGTEFGKSRYYFGKKRRKVSSKSSLSQIRKDINYIKSLKC